MKKLLFILFGLWTSLSFAQGVKFEQESFESVLEKAKAENKPVFIDVYTTWCKPCKWMEKEIFPLEEVGKFYNENFISYKFCCDKEDKELCRKFGVRIYPTLLFLDKEGNEIHRKTGAREGESIIDLGKLVLKGEHTFKAYKNKYKDGNRDIKFLKDYISKMNEAGIEPGTVFDDYYMALPLEEQISEEGFKILNKSLNTRESKVFPFFIEHAKDYQKYVPEYKVHNLIKRLYNSDDFYYAVKNNDKEKIDSVKKEIKLSGYYNSDVLLAQIEIMRHQINWDKEKFLESIDHFLNTHGKDNYYLLAKYTEQIANNRKLQDIDKTVLKKMQGWAEKSIELKNDYLRVRYVYVAILFRLGENDNAIKAANEGISLAKEQNTPERFNQLIEYYTKEKEENN